MEESQKELFEKLKGVLPELVNAKEMAAKFGTTEKEVREALASLKGDFTALETDCKALKADIEESKKVKRLSAMSGGAIDEKSAKDFGNFVFNMVKADQTPSAKVSGEIKGFQEEYATKAELNEGTTTEGGYLVPAVFANQIQALSVQASVAMQEASIIPITRGKALPNLSLNADLAVAFTAEKVAFTESEPTFTEADTNLKKLAAYCKISNELIEDEEVGIVQWLINRAALKMGQKIDKEAWMGDGTNFTGIFAAAGTHSFQMATAGNRLANISWIHLIGAESLVPTVALPGSKYYFSRAVLNYIKLEKDSQNRPIWMAPSGEQPGMVNGWPYVLVDQMPVAADDGIAKPFVCFGNMKNFGIGIKGGMTAAVSRELGLVNDDTYLAFRRRIAMVTLLPGAFAKIITAAT